MKYLILLISCCIGYAALAQVSSSSKPTVSGLNASSPATDAATQQREPNLSDLSQQLHELSNQVTMLSEEMNPPMKMAPDDTRPRPEEPGKTTVSTHIRRYSEIYLSLALLLFGAVVLGIHSFIVLKTGSADTTAATRIFGLTVIVTAGAFLTTAGYSETQIGPMIGLLGTSAGFLLGRTTPPSTSDGKSRNNPGA